MNQEEFINRYNEMFEGSPWYGDSLLGALKAIPPQSWNSKLIKGAKSVSEYVGHMINWRKFVIEKMKNNEAFNIEMNSKDDWSDEVLIKDEKEVNEFLEALKSTQQQINELVGSKHENWDKEQVIGGTYTNGYMLEGTLQHDIYHLGQLNLINSLLKRVK